MKIVAGIWFFLMLVAPFVQPEDAFKMWVADKYVPMCEGSVAKELPNQPSKAGAAYCACMVDAIRPTISALDMGLTTATFGLINMYKGKLQGSQVMRDACAAKAF